MQTDRAFWTRFYNEKPLREMPFHYANMKNSRFQLDYLTEVLRRCPGGRQNAGDGHRVWVWGDLAVTARCRGLWDRLRRRDCRAREAGQ